MRRRLASLSTLTCLILTLVIGGLHAGEPVGRANAGDPVEGSWLGTLKIPDGPQLGLVIDIERRSTGKLFANLISLDQGCMSMPIPEVAFKDDRLRLELAQAGLVIEGNIAGGENPTIEATFQQGGGRFPLPLKRVDQVPGYERPQTPRKPYPYREEDVTYANEDAGITIAGTLTLPRGEGPFGAVLLISGSGPQDRNEFLLFHRPFHVLADHLTRRGIAVLRVDDRGAGESTGNFDNATTADFADDVRAGLDYLSSREDIDPKRLGLVGHSEGGMIAPMVAAESSDVSFIVLIAGPGIPIPKLMALQHWADNKTDGKSDAEARIYRDFYQQLYQVMNHIDDNTAAAQEMRRLYGQLSDGDKKLLNWPAHKLDSVIADLLDPWHRYFVAFDPGTHLTKATCPVLAINGSKDCQVLPKPNLRGIEESLKAGGNRHYQIVELPGLNHLLQTARTDAISEYKEIQETIAPVALDTISDWIVTQCAGR